MKNYILTLLLLALAMSAKATHIVGGSITHQDLGGGQYLVTLEIYRDCYNGVPYFDDPVSIAVYDDFNNLYDQYTFPLNLSTIDTVSILPGNFVCVFPEGVCIEKAVYTGVVSLFNPGKFTVVHQRCCRTQILSNLVTPLDIGMTFFTVIDNNISNSSPVFNQDIPVAIFGGVPFVYDGSATDPDGDSLAYRLSTPYVGADVNDPMPSVPAAPPYNHASFLNPPYSESNMLGGNYPLVIDGETGEFSAIPTILGAFQIAYTVDEYRNGQIIGSTSRDFVFVVVPAEPAVNYDVSGKVMIDSLTPLDAGVVELLQRDVNNDSLYLQATYQVTSGGDYAFLDIPPGVFYLRAKADSSSAYFGNYLPTYYRSNLFWHDAITVNQCDTAQYYRDIFMVHIDSFTTGSPAALLRGVVRDAASGQVVPNLRLLLTSGSLYYQYTETDEHGKFSFSAVEGSYLIHVDLMNSGITNAFPPVVEINASQAGTANFLLRDDRLEFVEFTNIKEEDGLNGLKVQPNPTTGKANLVLPEGQSIPDGTKLTVWDANGKKVLSQILETAATVQITLPTAGLFFVNLVSPASTWTGKVLVY